MKKTTVVAVILAVLVLISLVQAVQLGGLKTKLEGGNVKVSSSAGSSPVASGSSADSGRTAALPSSVSSLPQMVGGC